MPNTGFCFIDDKHVPLYRILWISDVPHFCGADDCLVEGRYEIRLEQGESVFSTREQRDNAFEALKTWQLGEPDGDDQPPW